MGSTIYLQAVFACAVHLMQGGYFLVEHPAKPTDPARPSVSTSALVEFFRRRPSSHLHHVNQCHWPFMAWLMGLLGLLLQVQTSWHLSGSSWLRLRSLLASQPRPPPRRLFSRRVLQACRACSFPLHVLSTFPRLGRRSMNWRAGTPSSRRRMDDSILRSSRGTLRSSLLCLLRWWSRNSSGSCMLVAADVRLCVQSFGIGRSFSAVSAPTSGKTRVGCLISSLAWPSRFFLLLSNLRACVCSKGWTTLCTPGKKLCMEPGRLTVATSAQLSTFIKT